MVNLVRIVLGVLTAIYAVMFGKDYMESSKNGLLEAEEEKSWVKPGIIGFIANFGDTLGIGSFAPIVAMSKFSKMKVHDKQIPGMLNVSCCIPVVTEALLMTTAIAVEPITLVSMLAAAGAGSYIGAGIISKMDEKKIQLVMGIALLATAILMFLGLPWINLMPGGGNEIVLMPIASAKFIKEGQFPRKASLAITIGGVLGVFIAFYLVKSLPMDILKVLVIIVILYTSFTMLKPVLSKKQA